MNMRFALFERQYIGAYLFSLDDRSATNTFGTMEHQRNNYEFFSKNQHFSNAHSVDYRAAGGKRSSLFYRPFMRGCCPKVA
jgi:hypothetical protein